MALADKSYKLSPKQIRFCREYVVDNNGAKAAIRAGYSPKAAKEQAARLLTKANVKNFISDLRESVSNRLQTTADDVVKELKDLGFWSIQDFIGEGNTIKDISKITNSTVKPVVGIKRTERYLPDGTLKIETELKMVSKLDAIVNLGKHFGIFEKDNNQKKPETTPFSDDQVEKIITALREKHKGT